MKLTEDNVQELFLKCRFSEGDAGSWPISIEDRRGGVFGFNYRKVAENKTNIAILLSQLSDMFFEIGGGGYTYLDVSVLADGSRWTEDEQCADRLMAMGEAAGLAKTILSTEREHLPGTMPYFLVLKEATMIAALSVLDPPVDCEDSEAKLDGGVGRNDVLILDSVRKAFGHRPSTLPKSGK